VQDSGYPKLEDVARFTKNVLGGNGHEAEICQSSIEIEALSQVDAAEVAPRRPRSDY
jgi:hypothetical protein